MVDIPGSNNTFGSYVTFGGFGGERWVATGATTLRAWASSYSAEQNFTYKTGVDRGVATYENNVVNDAFRHNFMAAAIYVDNYNKNISSGMTPPQADSQAAYKALSDGSFNEWWQPNALNNSLKDYWNNYSGVEIGRAAVLDGQTGISNSDLAGRVGDVIRDSLARPGEGTAIIMPGAGRFPTDTFGEQARLTPSDVDPRLSADKYDMNRITGVGEFMPSNVKDFRNGPSTTDPFVTDPLGSHIPNVITPATGGTQVRGWNSDDVGDNLNNNEMETANDAYQAQGGNNNYGYGNPNQTAEGPSGGFVTDGSEPGAG